jgi:hypothetical protein
VRTTPKRLDANGATLQIGDAVYALLGEWLEAADMNPDQNSDAQTPIDLKKNRTGEIQREVRVPDAFAVAGYP